MRLLLPAINLLKKGKKLYPYSKTWKKNSPQIFIYLLFFGKLTEILLT